MGFTVLLYHRIHPKYGIKPEIFEKQILFLKKNFHILTIRDLKSSHRFPSILITFDDGFYDTFLYAYPIMKKYGVTGIVFVSPERVFEAGNRKKEDADVSTYNAFKNSFTKGDNRAFMSWQELKIASDILDVQSHCLSHKAAVGKGKPFKSTNDWRVYSLDEKERKKVKEETELTSIILTNEKTAREELMKSKLIIEEKLNKKVKAVAWPWGMYNENAVKIARDIGYEFCFTTDRGFNRKNYCNIKRLAVGEKKSMFWFITRTLLYSL